MALVFNRLSNYVANKMITVKDGQIIVTELRPMSDFPAIPDGEISVYVLVFLNFTDIPEIVVCDIRKRWPHSAYHGIGWLPTPIYQPEQKQEPVYLECGE